MTRAARLQSAHWRIASLNTFPYNDEKEVIKREFVNSRLLKFEKD